MGSGIRMAYFTCPSCGYKNYSLSYLHKGQKYHCAFCTKDFKIVRVTLP